MNLLAISELSKSDVVELFEITDRLNSTFESDLRSLLNGKTVCNLFFEESTRTRTSFDLAAKRLGADVINFDAAASSITKKGETESDTLLNIDAMGVDAFVIRHPSDGAVAELATYTKSVVINAGDGRNEHPSQALFDAYTIRAHRGPDFKGLKVAVAGDINHRVGRSNIRLLTLLGADVFVASPSWWLPSDFSDWTLGTGTVEVMETFDDAIAKCDVFYMLRVQFERDTSLEGLTAEDFHQEFGLTEERARRLGPDALVMAPGPINRGIELSDYAADGPNSVILEQVSNGVAMRKAILLKCLGANVG